MWCPQAWHHRLRHAFPPMNWFSNPIWKLCLPPFIHATVTFMGTSWHTSHYYSSWNSYHNLFLRKPAYREEVCVCVSMHMREHTHKHTYMCVCVCLCMYLYVCFVLKWMNKLLNLFSLEHMFMYRWMTTWG